MKCNRQLNYSNYVALNHFHRKAVNNSGLTTKEFNLLYYFAANEGRVLTYEQIYQKIWGNYVQDIENNTIGSHVCKLREKLYKACPDRKFEIRCVREIGYCFEAK